MIINRNRQRGILHPLPACFALFAGSGPTQVHAIVLDTHGGHIGAADIVHLFNSRQYGGTHLKMEVGQRGQALPKHVLSLLGTRLYAGIDTAVNVQSFSVKTIYILLASCCLLDNLHIQSKNNFCEEIMSHKLLFFKLSHLHCTIKKKFLNNFYFDRYFLQEWLHVDNTFTPVINALNLFYMTVCVINVQS